MALTLAEKINAVKNALNLGLAPQPSGNVSPDLHFFTYMLVLNILDVALMLQTNAVPPNLRVLVLCSSQLRGGLFHGSSPFPY